MSDPKWDDTEEISTASWGDTEEVEEPNLDKTSTLTKKAGVGAGIAGAQVLASKTGLDDAVVKGVKSLPNKIVTALGELESDDISKIYKNPEMYKQVGGTPDFVYKELEPIIEDLSDKPRRLAIQARKRIADKELEIPKESIEQELEEIKKQKSQPADKKKLKQYRQNKTRLKNIEKKSIKPREAKLKELNTKFDSFIQKSKEELTDLKAQKQRIEDAIFKETNPKRKKQLKKLNKKINLDIKAKRIKIEKNTNSYKKSIKDKKRVLETKLKQYADLKQKTDKLPKTELIYDEGVKAFVDQEKARLAQIENPKGKYLSSELDRLTNEEIVYSDNYQKPSSRAQAAGDFKKSLRSKVAETDPKVQKLFEQSSEGIKAKEELKNILGLKGNPKHREPLKVDDKTIRKIKKIFENPKENQKAIKELVRIASKNDLDWKELFTKADLARINDAVEKTTGIKNFKFRDIALGGMASRIMGLPILPIAAAKATIGSKVQEAVATTAGDIANSKFGQFVGDVIDSPLTKKAGKLGYKSLPILGATMAFNEAKAAGMSTPEALAYAAAEEINPTPISGLDVKKALDKEAPRRSAQVRKKAEKRFSVSGAEERAKRLQEEKQNKQRLLKQSKELRNSTSEDFNGLSQKFMEKGNQEYSRVLEKLANAGDRTKNSMLFALHQQPAFRDLYNKIKEEEEDIA